MKKRIQSIIITIALVMGLAACGSDKGADMADGKTKITFVLDWTPNTNHTGIYAACELGYFADAGLEVEIVQPPEGGAELLVGTQAAQFGVSFQDSLLPVLIGDDAIPVEAVAAILQHNTSGIISRAGEGMETPKGMEGKKYATWDMELEKATIKHVMQADGGDFEKVELIPSTVTDEVSALKSQSVDAIWVFYGWAGIATEVAGLDTDYFAFADIDSVFDFYTPVIIGNTEWMKDNPEITKAFLTAVSKGYEYAIEHPEEAADILHRAAPELDEELVYASQEYMKDQYKAETAQWGYIDPARWNAYYDWVDAQGIFDAEIPDNIGFNNEYLE